MGKKWGWCFFDYLRKNNMGGGWERGAERPEVLRQQHTLGVPPEHI